MGIEKKCVYYCIQTWRDDHILFLKVSVTFSNTDSSLLHIKSLHLINLYVFKNGKMEACNKFCIAFHLVNGTQHRIFWPIWHMLIKINIKINTHIGFGDPSKAWKPMTPSKGLRTMDTLMLSYLIDPQLTQNNGSFWFTTMYNTYVHN